MARQIEGKTRQGLDAQGRRYAPCDGDPVGPLGQQADVDIRTKGVEYGAEVLEVW